MATALDAQGFSLRTCKFVFWCDELSSPPFSFPHASDFRHLGCRCILGPPVIHKICCSRCIDPQRGMLKAGLDLHYPVSYPAFTCHLWPALPLAPHTRAREGGGAKSEGQGHGWRWEQMAGRVTSVVRLSGPIIPPDGPPALLLFPAPGQPGLPRQRRLAATWACPGRERAVLSPHLALLLLICPEQRQLLDNPTWLSPPLFPLACRQGG